MSHAFCFNAVIKKQVRIRNTQVKFEKKHSIYLISGKFTSTMNLSDTERQYGVKCLFNFVN